MSIHQVTRFEIPVAQTYEAFRSRFRAAVPPFNTKRLAEFVARKASWAEVVADANAASPYGFFIFWSLEVDESMALNGNLGKCSEYLMGNNTIAERIYRANPVAMLYVPLRIVVYETPGSSTMFIIEQPSSTLSSVQSRQIDAVGAELDAKLAALLGHLSMPLPRELVAASNGEAD